jgi:ACR3 family arsenite transporter
MNVFERYLTVWVFLCIIMGIALGQFLPAVFQVIGSLSVAQVNLPVGLLIWVMIIPMLVKVDFGERHLRNAFRQLAGEALFDGTPGLDLHSACLCPTAAGRSAR